MKEFYIAPEVKRLAFLPQEELMGSNFDDLLGGNQGGGLQFGTPGSETTIDPGDIELPV